MGTTLIVDGANVVGSRPDGWWKDRAGAARRLHAALVAALVTADLAYDAVILVLEGQARAGVEAGKVGSLQTVHAPRDGDSHIVALVEELGRARDGPVSVVTADRGLSAAVEEAGGQVRRPGWLLDLLPSP